MIKIILIYIIGVVIHKYGFSYNRPKEMGGVLDYPEIKDMEPLFTVFSIIWPLFWVVFLFLYLKELTIKLIKRK